MKFNDQIYTLSDLENAITNLRPGVLRVWIGRGVVEIGDKAPGRGAKRLFTLREALIVNTMAFLTLQEISSAQACAVGTAAANEVERFVAEGGLLDMSEIDIDTWPVLVWNYGKSLDYKVIPRCDLPKYPKGYYQVFDFLYFAIGLSENLMSVRDVRIRQGK